MCASSGSRRKQQEKYLEIRLHNHTGIVPPPPLARRWKKSSSRPSTGRSPLADVPISITVLDGQALQDQGITRIEDFTALARA